jgi:phage shock protein C
MNKIISINLCSIVFQIDETAYESLRIYLHDIRTNLGSQTSANEIYEDVENRIAELFQNKINSGKQAIMPSDVEEIKKLMGDATQFMDIGDGSKANANNNANQFQAPVYRSVYRNGDDKVLGGVCSGLAYYFKVDPLIIRIVWAAMLLMAGSGLLVYILLWILIPEAKTSAEKMAMMGRPFTFDSIKQNFKVDGDQIKQRMNNFGDEVSDASKRILNSQTYSGINNRGTQLIRGGFKFIALMVLIFLLLIFLPIAIAIAVVLSTVGLGSASILSIFLASSSMSTLFCFGVLLFIFIPILFIGYKIIQLIFNTTNISSWLKTTLTVSWVAGFFMIISVVLYLKKDFDKKDSISQSITLIPSSVNTYYLAGYGGRNYKPSRVGITVNNLSRKFVFNGLDFGQLKTIKDSLLNANILLDILPSTDSSASITIIKSARGIDQAAANNRIMAMNYNFIQQDSIIYLPHHFTSLQGDVWRNQKIKLVIKIPVGKKIVLDENTAQLINNFNNYDDEGDETTRKFEMTNSGAKPIK